MIQKFKPQREFTDAQAAQFWSGLSKAAAHAIGLEEVLDAVWDSEGHSLPCHPALWEIWRNRIVVSPTVHSGKLKNPFLRELMSRPNQPMLVSDSVLPGASSLHYCVALQEPADIVPLLLRQSVSRAVVRQYDDRYLFAAPVSSFFNTHA